MDAARTMCTPSLMFIQPPPAPEGFDPLQPPIELLGFFATFATYGAAAFGAVVLPVGGLVRPAASRRASTIGIVGVLLAFLWIFVDLAHDAAEKHDALGTVIAAGGAMLGWRVACHVVALIGFVLARRGASSRTGFGLAALAVLGLALRNVVTGDWRRLVNPLHIFAGGLWIGTLSVLFIALLSPSARRAWSVGRDGESHASATASLVRRFSTLALFASSLLLLTGVITAWRHLKYVAALWTTPYGWALDLKLLLVATVAGFGAFNWRVASPHLGDASSTESLARSARAELAVALVVLVVTAILVSIPAPRLPGPPPS